MKLFFYKPKRFNPLIFLICKLSNKEELEKLEAWTTEIFQILLEENEATNENILIFSIIKEFEKSTVNLVMASTKSNQTLTNRCYKDKVFLNAVIVETLKKSNSKFYIELTNEKVLIHQKELNLSSLSQFYST
jgi:hypothetical protein